MARKLFLQFITCAMIPIIILAVISYFSIARQMRLQSQRYLHIASKLTVMSMIGKLVSLDSELRDLAARITTNPPPAGRMKIPAKQQNSFTTLEIIPSDSKKLPKFTGKTILLVSKGDKTLTKGFYLIRPLDTQAPWRGMIAGKINSINFWKDVRLNQHNIDTSVFDISTRQRIFSSLRPPPSFPGEILQQPIRHTVARSFLWDQNGKNYVANIRLLFLEGQFKSPKWVLLLSETKTSFSQIVSNFHKTFPQTILITILIISLFTLYQIRNRMEPLERLKNGFMEIARQKFDHKVAIHTGDEFEELASSFNQMSYELRTQFATLEARNQIDWEILSSMDIDHIARTVTNSMAKLGHGDYSGVLIKSHTSDINALYFIREKTQEIEISNNCRLTPPEEEKLKRLFFTI